LFTQVREVLRDPKYLVKFSKRGKRLAKHDRRLKRSIWMPPSIRHIDNSAYYERDESNLPLRERRKHDEIKTLIVNKEDINFDDAFVKSLKEKYDKESQDSESLQPEADRNKKRLLKSRRMRALYEANLKEEEEFNDKFPIDIF
jgi:hypothetical protein